MQLAGTGIAGIAVVSAIFARMILLAVKKLRQATSRMVSHEA